MNQRKRQHEEWDDELDVYLSKILFCEVCGIRKATDKAHRLKRRFIGWRSELDRLEYFMAAKLCRPCHRRFDEGTGEAVHEAMYEGITKIVLRRARGRVVGVYVRPHPQRWWDPVLVNSVQR